MQNRPSAYNQVFDGSYLCSKNKAQLVLFCNDCTIIDCLGYKKVNLFFTKKTLLYAEGQVYFKYDHYMWNEIQPTIQFFRRKMSENDCIESWPHYPKASYISFKFTVSNDIGKKNVNKIYKSKNVI